jgi:hypothetical protein
MRRQVSVKNNRRKDESTLASYAKHERMLEVPPLGPVGRVPFSIRYTPATAVGCQFTTAAALALLAFSKTTTTAQTCIVAIKLKKLHVWVPGFAVNAGAAVVPPYVNVSIRDFVVPGLGVEKEYNVTGQGAKGSYFCYKFRGFASEWFNSVGIGTSYLAEQIFVIATVGAIPLVQLDFVVQLPQTASGPTAAAALTFGMTVDTTAAGSFLYMPLNSMVDGDTEGNGTWLPVGCQTITVNMPRPLLASKCPPVLPALVSCSSEKHSTEASVCSCARH